jgi:hypothetical protein
MLIFSDSDSFDFESFFGDDTQLFSFIFFFIIVLSGGIAVVKVE